MKADNKGQFSAAQLVAEPRGYSPFLLVGPRYLTLKKCHGESMTECGTVGEEYHVKSIVAYDDVSGAIFDPRKLTRHKWNRCNLFTA